MLKLLPNMACHKPYRGSYVRVAINEGVEAGYH